MISVAVLGAGIGAEHLKAYRALCNDFRVLYVIDKDTDRAKALPNSDQFQISASVEDSLDDARVDLIDVCLPPHLHAQYTIEALEAGKHVVCEKPLATSLSDVSRIRAAIGRSGKSVYPVFQYRFGKAMTQLQALVTSGLAGRCVLAALETHWSRDETYYAADWRGTWAGEAGGAVLCHAIHVHDLLTLVMGPVHSLSAFITTRVNDIETEDCAAISLQMKNGALATSSVTLGAATNETRLRFVFENLMATSGTNPYAPASERWTFTARRPELQPQIDACIRSVAGQHSGFRGFLGQVARHIAGHPANIVTFDEAASSIELVTAIYHAARTGERVAVPITKHHPLYGGWAP